MNSYLIPMTAQTPSRFCLPTGGHASRVTVWGAAVRGVAGTAMSTAKRARITGDLGFIPAHVPGTSVWSPPTS